MSTHSAGLGRVPALWCLLKFLGGRLLLLPAIRRVLGSCWQRSVPCCPASVFSPFPHAPIAVLSGVQRSIVQQPAAAAGDAVSSVRRLGRQRAVRHVAGRSRVPRKRIRDQRADCRRHRQVAVTRPPCEMLMHRWGDKRTHRLRSSLPGRFGFRHQGLPSRSCSIVAACSRIKTVAFVNSSRSVRIIVV